MRRKARLKVLYWPLFASVCVILLLISIGPGRGIVPPPVAKWWNSQGFAATIGSWLPGGDDWTRGVTARWPHIARQTHNRHSHAPVQSAPRTLADQNQAASQGAVGTFADARPSVDVATAPRSFFSPHALRSQSESVVWPIAEIRLLAPQRMIEEELAGLDRAPLASGSLVSQVIPSEEIEFFTTEESAASSGVHVGDDVRDGAKRVADAHRHAHGIGGGWPETPQLIRDLDTVARVAAAKGMTRFASSRAARFDFDDWQSETKYYLQRLTTLQSISSPEAGELLASLQRLADVGRDAAEEMSDRELQIRLLQASHGLERRMAVWNSVWRTTQGTVERVGDLAADSDELAMNVYETQSLIEMVREDARTSDDSEGWVQFLILDDLAATNQGTDATARRVAAQRFLSRITWHRLNAGQKSWLERASVRNLALALRRWAAMPLDYAALLVQIERQETDAIDLGGIDVASAVQTLRFAESREANQIADSLNTYYRNANIRVAITSELISRMIPDVDAQVQPVRDRILGADVRGTSVAHSDISLRLVPSDRSWKMLLENNGNVSTGAASRQWPVLIRSQSQATFSSSTPLEITPDGAAAGSTDVAVNSRTRVRNVETDFDTIPLVSLLVRELAMSRYESMAPVAQRIQKSKIRDGVSEQVETRVSEQLDEAADMLARRLTGPLGTLKLNPLVVDMKTTDSRLSARYRVAGDWQLAAFSPRPRAPLASLMSVQVHQSVFNNTLETILPSGQPQTIAALTQQIKELFAIENSAGSEGKSDGKEELAESTSIQFAATRPITIEIENEILWITLRVMRLNQDRNVDLRRFIVRAGYRPVVDGMSVRLAREGHLRISGPSMSLRERLPVRAIFNKVFSSEQTLPLVPQAWTEHRSMEGLAITQAELRDGWIAIAVGKSSDIALAPQIARNEGDDEQDERQTF